MIVVTSMQAIRTIKKANTQSVMIEIPESFVGREIEIIILPVQQIETPIKRKSLRGCLRKYADQSLMTLEDTAWQNSVCED